MDSLLQDLRHAVRSLIATPAFTLAALLTLAIGIGANSAIFSVVDGVLLRPTPVGDIDRLMMVWQTDRNTGTTREPASVPDLVDFRSRSRQFTTLEAILPAELNLTPDNADPRRVAAIASTTGMLPMLGIQPLHGRVFTETEGTAGNQQVAIISETLWETMFARDPGAVGQSLRLNDVPHRIVGVMPRGADFGMLQMLSSAAYGRAFAERGRRADVDVWVPFVLSPTASRDNHPILVLGRLAAGANVNAAQQEMAQISEDLERSYPSNAGRGVNVEPFESVVFGRTSTSLFVLLGAVAMVLLVACVNVANLMLARNSARLREVTVRIALGASRKRIVQQFLVEGAVLVGTGALLGIVVADWGLRAMLAIAPATIPRLDNAGLDSRVVLATAVVTVVVALIFGLLPTLQTRRLELQQALQQTGAKGASGGRSQRRWRSILVVGQLAAAVTLMVCAGLLVRSLWQLQQVEPGFVAQGVLKAEYQLPASRYPGNTPGVPEQRKFNDALQSRVSQIPGVQSVALSINHPLDGGFTSSISVVGREAEADSWAEPTVRIIGVSYFETMQVPVSDGRFFSGSDEATSPSVIIINEAAKQRYFASQDPMGQQIFLWGANRTVVGVVGNERFQGLSEDAPPAVYLPMAQMPSRFGAHTLLVRTSGDPSALISPLQTIVRELDAQLPLFAIEPLSETISGSLAQRRFTMLVLAAFALIALSLAVIGVHGVLNYAVSLRTREIGIRVALGAAPKQVQRAIVGEGALLAGLGLAIGLVAALALTRVLSSLLYGIGQYDPTTFAGVALVLGATALLACYIPARRAARVDPIVALRSE